MKTYITKQGDMWDSIAFNQMGNTKYADKIMELNNHYISYFIFPAGIELTIPDIVKAENSTLPPWKRASG